MHLAGASVAEKKWSEERKQEIIDSRVNTTRLLFDKLAGDGYPCDTVIAASAIGIYGADSGATWVDENSPAGKGFLAKVTELWEREIARFNEINLRVVTLRTGIVLSSRGGAFPKIAQPIKLNLGAVLGSGEQYMSWIHIDDLCHIIKAAIEKLQFSGVYNAVAPAPVTNKEFTRILAKKLNKPLWLPAVPGWVLRASLGEMAQLVLGGNRVSSKKITDHRYSFEYADLPAALEAVLNGENGN